MINHKDFTDSWIHYWANLENLPHSRDEMGNAMLRFLRDNHWFVSEMNNRDYEEDKWA